MAFGDVAALLFSEADWERILTYVQTAGLSNWGQQMIKTRRRIIRMEKDECAPIQLKEKEWKKFKDIVSELKAEDREICVTALNHARKAEDYAEKYSAEVAKWLDETSPQHGFYKGDLVKVRDDGSDWKYGVVAQLQPLAVHLDGQPNVLRGNWDMVQLMSAEEEQLHRAILLSTKQQKDELEV